MKALRVLGCLAIVGLLAALPACGGGKPAQRQKYGKYTLYGIKYDNADRGKAKDNAADLLTQMQGEKNICLIGLWAYNPPAILEAVKAGKKEGKVTIVGFDEDPLTLQGIKDGYIAATVVQQPFEFGYQSVKIMALLAKNPKAKLPNEVKDGIFHIPHKVIDKDNVEAFSKQLAKQKAAGRVKAEDKEEEDGIKVGFVSNNAEEFWTIAEAGTRKAAADLGVGVLFRRPKTPDAAGQKEIIEDLLTRGVKAIAISVIDPENQVEYLNKIADRVPLITQDNDAPRTRRRVYIGTDNYEAGKAVGKIVKKALPDGGAIAIFVGQPDPLNSKQRRQGVLDELAGEKDAQGK
jgi:ribose transport system substrate-binding protein